MKAILLMLCLTTGIYSFGQTSQEPRVSKQEFASTREKLVQQVHNRKIQEAEKTYLELYRMMTAEVNALEIDGGPKGSDAKKKELFSRKMAVFQDVRVLRKDMETNISGLDGKLKEYELTIL